MTDPKILGARLLVPEKECARSFASGRDEACASAGLSFLVVVLLRCREGREADLVELGLDKSAL